MCPLCGSPQGLTETARRQWRCETCQRAIGAPFVSYRASNGTIVEVELSPRIKLTFDYWLNKGLTFDQVWAMLTAEKQLDLRNEAKALIRQNLQQQSTVQAPHINGHNPAQAIAANGGTGAPGSNGHKPSQNGALPDGLFANDMGNATRLTRNHGDKIRYVYDMERWIVLQDNYWPFDDRGRVVELAKTIGPAILTMADKILDDYRQLADTLDDTEANRLKEHAAAVRKFGISSGNGGRLENAIKFARPLVPILAEDLDTHDWLIDCDNGTIDLHTGILMAHDAARMITKRVHIDYDPNATCPNWEAFLLRIMSNDTDKVRFLQQTLGYSLTGDISEQCAFFLWGQGKNGKSVWTEVVRGVFGELARHADTTTFEARSADRVRSDIARLQGARLVTTSEGDEPIAGHEGHVSESTIKKVTGGEPVVAAFKFRDEFEFKPKFKLFWITNHKPIIRGGDKGIWRRIRLVPFTYEFPEKERRPMTEVVQELLGEAAGIFTWMVRGCLDWQRESLIRTPPKSIQDAIDHYRDEMNSLGDFLALECVEHPQATAGVGDLYRRYVEICEMMREKPMGKITFGNRLKQMGFEQVKGTAGTRNWVGISIKGMFDVPKPRDNQDPLPDEAPKSAGVFAAAPSPESGPSYFPPAVRYRLLVESMRRLGGASLLDVRIEDLEKAMLGEKIAPNYVSKDIAVMLERGKLILSSTGMVRLAE